jgi:hypothetical protein
MSDAALWRSRRVIGTAAICGLIVATAGIAIVPSTALWTGGIVCSGSDHLDYDASSTSFGNTSQENRTFVCETADGRPTSDASTLAILALQLLLGGVIAYAVIVGGGYLRQRLGSA